MLVGPLVLLPTPALRPALLRSSAITAIAPSGIDGLPLTDQAAQVAGIFVVLGAASIAGTATLEAIGDAVAGTDRTKTKIGGAFACVLGAAFCLAGYGHFALPAAYQAIYPPTGTWGFWYLPGSASFHVTWTGVAEILGGLGLFLGGLGDIFGDPLSGGRARPLRQLSASSLFVLMVAVFPANIYQYTHGAIMTGAGPDDGPLPLEYHYARLVIQVALLSALSLLSKEEGNPMLSQKAAARDPGS